MFIDTNYFLRYLFQDIKEQNLLVEKIFSDAIEEKLKLITSTVVFFEVYWVLNKYYKKNKTEAVSLLRQLLKLSFIELKEQDILVSCLFLFEKSNLDLEDCYNLFYAKDAGVKEFKTFDKKLEKEFMR